MDSIKYQQNIKYSSIKFNLKGSPGDIWVVTGWIFPSTLLVLSRYFMTGSYHHRTCFAYMIRRKYEGSTLSKYSKYKGGGNINQVTTRLRPNHVTLASLSLSPFFSIILTWKFENAKTTLFFFRVWNKILCSFSMVPS